jgi:hypothetical protein
MTHMITKLLKMPVHDSLTAWWSTSVCLSYAFLVQQFSKTSISHMPYTSSLKGSTINLLKSQDKQHKCVFPDKFPA